MTPDRTKFVVEYGGWKFLWRWNLWTERQEFTGRRVFQQTEQDGTITVNMTVTDIQDVRILKAPWWMRLLYVLVAKPCLWVSHLSDSRATGSE